MLFTVIGDPHAKLDNLDKIDTLFDIVDDLNNHVILLGDLLDTKEIIRGKCLNKLIERIKKTAVKHSIIVLVGNHDWFNLECKDHALQALKGLDNVIVVDEPTVQFGMNFIPFHSDPEVIRVWLRNMKPNPKVFKALFCHVDLKGWDQGNGHISEAGLDLEDFKAFPAVISGHYHKYQTQKNFTYLGTPFSHSFGETDQAKYIGIFNDETNELELLDSPFPSHCTIELNCAKKMPKLTLDDGNIYRLILNGTQEQIDKVPRIAGVKYIERPGEEVSKALISEADSTEVQFRKWAKDIKGYSTDLVKLGLEILKDV